MADIPAPAFGCPNSPPTVPYSCPTSPHTVVLLLLIHLSYFSSYSCPILPLQLSYFSSVLLMHRHLRYTYSPLLHRSAFTQVCQLPASLQACLHNYGQFKCQHAQVQDVEPERNSLPACPAPSPKGQPGTLSPPSPPIRDQVYTLSIPPTCPVYSLQGSSTPVSSTSLPRGLASLHTAHTPSPVPLLEPLAPTMCPVPVQVSQCSDLSYKKLGPSLQHPGQLEQVFRSPV